ncbi:hypothetical protein, partial [Escherichia coli]|uniref:hypothetical protein n=1 Tax=Escherichia coli TaxID=562 RepID=UPI001BC82E37
VKKSMFCRRNHISAIGFSRKISPDDKKIRHATKQTNVPVRLAFFIFYFILAEEHGIIPCFR